MAQADVLHAACVPADLARAWHAECAEWFRPERARVPGAPDHEHLALVETSVGEVIAKRETQRGWKGTLQRARLRRPRSVRAFELGTELVRIGIATPEPLACLVGAGGRRDRAVLVTRRERGTDPWTFLSSPASIPTPHPPRGAAERTDAPRNGFLPSNESLAELLTALATALAALHAAGFRHRDLKAPNLLITRTPRGELRVTWLDLDGLSKPGTVAERTRIRDLARLCASFGSDAAHTAGIDGIAGAHWRDFVRRYLELTSTRPGAEAETDRIVLATAAWARAHIRRNESRSRPTN